MTPEPESARIAIFDLDGTLTWRDTLVPFLLSCFCARPQRLIRLWRLPGTVLGYLLSGRDRGVLKARLIQLTLGGDRRADVEAWAQQFVARMPARGFFRPAALAALEEHRRAGDRLVLLSASPDIYVPLIGRLLHVTQTICTEVSWRGDRLDGTLRSANRLGEEKLRVLEALRAEYPGKQVVAYGNSADDLAHLRHADVALVVNANRGTRRSARQLGLATGEWR